MREIFRWSIRILAALPLSIALWWLSAYAGVLSGDLAALPHNPSVERAALVVSALVVGIAPGLLLVLPFTWVYGRCAVHAAAAVAVLVALSRVQYALDARSDFAAGIFWLEATAIAVFPPVAVWAFRRLRPNNSFKPKPLRGSA